MKHLKYLKGNTMVSKKAMHALNILVVVAGVPYGATVSTQAVAKALQLSVSYLEGLIKTLRDHQLIRSFRGPGGGYQMEQDPFDITVWEVVKIFSGFSDEAGRPGDQASLTGWLEEQIDLTRAAFLKAHSIGELVSPQSEYSVRADRADSSVGFKPMPPVLRPHAPNSVFNLPEFYQLEAA